MSTTTRTTSTAEESRLEERIWNANQSWNFESIHRIDDFKLRVQIRRNAYDFQSHLRIEVFDKPKLQWQEVESLAMTQDRASHTISYVDRHPNVALFHQDEAELLRLAKQVLL